MAGDAASKTVGCNWPSSDWPASRACQPSPTNCNRWPPAPVPAIRCRMPPSTDWLPLATPAAGQRSRTGFSRRSTRIGSWLVRSDEVGPGCRRPQCGSSAGAGYLAGQLGGFDRLVPGSQRGLRQTGLGARRKAAADGRCQTGCVICIRSAAATGPVGRAEQGRRHRRGCRRRRPRKSPNWWPK